MRIIEPSFEILSLDRERVVQFLEQCGRVCYKSEDRITEDSANTFISNILSSQHESVIEHASMTVRFICDRGVSHELVRHRLASFSQESTRYCNYSKDKFDNQITVIKPCFWQVNHIQYTAWKQACEYAESCYFELVNRGAKPQEARSILPNSLKTEIIMTANLREWRHVLKLRTSEKAHPQIREIMVPLLKVLKEEMPVLFGAI